MKLEKKDVRSSLYIHCRRNTKNDEKKRENKEKIQIRKTYLKKN